MFGDMGYTIRHSDSVRGGFLCHGRLERVMSQREEFMTLAQSEGVNMSELCLRSGISRKTGYKWLRRWLEGGRGESGRPP